MTRAKNKSYLTWNGYIRLIGRLYNKISWSKEKFSYIVAISRGGNIIGTILSHKSGLPLQIISPATPLPDYPKILIVDEIADTGTTLKNLLLTKKDHVQYKIATLHMKKGTTVVPDYFVHVNKKWIVYPYEEQ